MDTQRFSRLFPFGSHLCREPMPPMSELKRDMETLRARGFNLIKLQVHWMIDEPAEEVYDFSRYEELIEHAAGLDLGVYVGLTCEQAPAWLYRKYPDCRMVGRNGRVIVYEAPTTLPADGKPGPCFDHPGVRDDQARFLTRLVKTLGRFENVVLWNTWQEIGYWTEGLLGTSVCYCSYTLAHFRRWLRRRYGDLDALNRAWNTRYAEWEDVLPNRSRAQAPEAVELAWQYFMANVKIAEVLRARAAAIGAADPLRRPIFAHKGSPSFGSAQDWVYARCQDFLGCSCYPAWASLEAWDDDYPAAGAPLDRTAALLAEMREGVARRYDYIRSCNRPGAPVWAAEFQGGPISTGLHKGRVPTANDLRRWLLTAVASGVTAISFWVTRAEIMAAEMNGFSLLDSVGDSTPRLEEAGRIGRALNRYPELFGQPTTPLAPVGLLINEDNFLFCQALSPGGEHLGYSLTGWYRLLWEAGIPMDFVSLSGPQEAPLDEYSVLILPFPVCLSEETARRLAAYVEAGGHLICEAAPGRVNEQAFCNRGELSPTMAALFEVRQADFVMVREPDGGRRWSPRERTWGEYRDPLVLTGAGPLAGHSLRANAYLETFTVEDSEPCLLAGEAVAGVVRRVGPGRAWLLGTYAGHSGVAYRD